MRWDRTVQLLREGYPWAGRVRGGAVAVRTRLFGRPAVVVATTKQEARRPEA